MKRFLYVICFILISSLVLFCSNKRANSGVFISEFMASNKAFMMDEFEVYSDWIELSNPSKDTVDLTGYYLSDDSNNLTKYRIEGLSINPLKQVTLWASGKDSITGHVNFKLKKERGEILLTDPSGGEVISKVSYNTQVKNYSSTLVDSDWFLSASPSFGKENEKRGHYLKLAPEVAIDFEEKEGSLYTSLRASREGEIKFTIDGSSPFTKEAITYKEPFLMDSSSFIRAACFGENLLTIDESKRAYIPKTKHQLPVISLTTTPESLWDDSLGIYTMGSFDNCKKRTAEWVRKGSLEYYDLEGNIHEHDVDFKIYGAGTRVRPKKSLSVLTNDSFPNYFFSSNGNEHLDGFVLRACYSDASRFKNEVVNGVNAAMKSNLLMQEYHPGALYINGEYWGLFNISERKNDEFIEAHRNKKVAHLMNANSRKVFAHKGENDSYVLFLDSINRMDFTSEKAFDYLSENFDLASLLDFWCHELYTLKADRFNNRFWKTDEEGAKWNYVGYDFDIGFVWPINPRTVKNFKVKDAAGIEIFGKLMENGRFSKMFFERLCDYMNFGYHPEVVSEILENADSLTREEFKLDYLRWEEEWPKCLDQGDVQKKKILSFLEPRSIYMRDSIASRFGFKDQVIIKNPDPEKGVILVNNYEVIDQAIYFTSMELDIKVIPAKGYSFNHWIDESSSKVNIPSAFIADRAMTIEPIFSK